MKKRNKNLNAQISDEQIEKVSGGYIFNSNSESDFKYLTVDDGSGKVLGRYRTPEEAHSAAAIKRVSQAELNHDEWGNFIMEIPASFD